MHLIIPSFFNLQKYSFLLVIKSFATKKVDGIAAAIISTICVICVVPFTS